MYANDGRTSDGRKPNTIESYRAKIKDMFRPAMLKPFRLIVGYELIFHCAALTGIRCYMVEIFRSLRMPIEAEWLVVSAYLFSFRSLPFRSFLSNGYRLPRDGRLRLRIHRYIGNQIVARRKLRTETAFYFSYARTYTSIRILVLT